MALRFLLDEHLRGPLWHAIQQHNATGIQVLDVVRVGDVPGLPLGTPDADLLVWGEPHGRVLVSEDRRTMPGHLTTHFLAGHHTTGLILLKRGWTIASMLAALILHDQLLGPVDMIDRAEFVG